MAAPGTIKLDTMSKTSLITIYFVFVVFLVAAAVIGVLGPKELHEEIHSAYDCEGGASRFEFDPVKCKGVDLSKKQEYSGTMGKVEPLHQYVMLVATIYNKKHSDYGVHKTLKTAVKLSGRSSKDDEWTLIKEHEHDREIKCKDNEEKCDPIVLLNTNELTEYTEYQTNVSFRWTSSEEVDFIGDVDFTFRRADKSFTLFEVVFRYVFLAFTLVGILEYSIYTRRYLDKSAWLTENKWIVYLLILLTCYNNPLFGLHLIFNGYFLPVLSSLLFVTFIAGIFLFWLIMIDGIYKENADQRSFMSFYFPKIVWAIVFWIGLAIYYSLTRLLEHDDPTFKASDLNHFKYYMGSIFAWIVIWAFWFFHILFRCWEELAVLRTPPARFRFFSFITVQVIFIATAGIVFSQIGPHYNSSASFLAFLALFNLYCYVIAFVYLPADNVFRDRDVRGPAPSAGRGPQYDSRDDVHIMRMDDEDIMMSDFHNL
eukprot:GFYU01000369.1.p1 GENE.GFYU01000369.1~~GFYU01000369.1.p1  ORF type:complete len:483 (-),score=149.66 GFYU01000369.1:180-1628(-)